jgi:hypothetical protein
MQNDQWVTKEIEEAIKKFLESNENENTMYQNLWDTAKVIVKGKVYSYKCLQKGNRLLK